MMSAHFMLYALLPQSVTTAEARFLIALSSQPDLCWPGDGRSVARARARDLSSRGLVEYVSAKQGGWDAAMWSAVLTCPGAAAADRDAGDRHVTYDGCGSPWLPQGTCQGCGVLRRLDLAAFETLPQEDERAGRARLWCDEHGYLRRSQWVTDKTCRLPAKSPWHPGTTTRVYS